jgi:hypothetical protein
MSAPEIKGRTTNLKTPSLERRYEETYLILIEWGILIRGILKR